MNDLMIKGGRVIDPSQNLDDNLDVLIKDGKVISLQNDKSQRGADLVLDAQGLIVTPGLIDIHVHIFEGVSFFGISADKTCLDRGVTTALDAGSSGADNFSRLRRDIINTSKTNLKVFLHLSKIGLINR